MNKLAGESREQREAGEWLLNEYEKKRGVRLEKDKRLCLDNESYIELDGFCDTPGIMCEVYAHVGKLKGGQPDKVMSDAFKLLFINHAKFNSEYGLVLLFGDREAAARFQVTSKTWMARCLREWDIEVAVIEFDEEIGKGLEQAQERQRR